MQLPRTLGGMLAIWALLAGVPFAAAQPRQAAVTGVEIQRLQDAIEDAATDVSGVRASDPQAGRDLQARLDDLHDEVVYLRVKLRKEGSVPRSDYLNLQRRIDRLRSDAHNLLYGPAAEYGSQTTATSGRTAAPVATPVQPTASDPDEVPVGAELDVRLQTPLSSESAQVEDRVDATTLVDLSNGGRVLIPAGSVVRGVVTSVQKATRLERRGSLTIGFDQMTIGHRSYPIQATVDQVLASEGLRGEAGRIGAGAGVGAVIGGLLGGVKGALAGVLIGGGGTVAATTGTDVNLQPGTVVRIRFDSPLVVR